MQCDAAGQAVTTASRSVLWGDRGRSASGTSPLITQATGADEFAYVQQATYEAGPAAEAGLHHDDWNDLSLRERTRRTRWLARHSETPIQQLDLTEGQLKVAGLRVVDWGVPKGEAGVRRSRYRL